MQILTSNLYYIDTVKMNCKTYMYIYVCLYVSLCTQYVAKIQAYQYAPLLKPNILILANLVFAWCS